VSQGAFCLVLHGHLPWVLHHGRWPHGEDWLFEAVSETWLPLLSVVEQCANEGINASWTVGLMPILLEQLAHDRFKQGFVVWLTEQAERAESDREGFYTDGDGHLGWLAERYGVRFREQLVQFEALNRDIPGAWRLGRAAVLQRDPRLPPSVAARRMCPSADSSGPGRHRASLGHSRPRLLAARVRLPPGRTVDATCGAR